MDFEAPYEGKKSNGIYDYLSLASDTKHQGAEAVKDSKSDDAWYFFYQRQAAYAKYANSIFSMPTEKQALSLISSVNKSLGNVLRNEDKYRLAPRHIIYWYAWREVSRRANKSMKTSLNSYFNRCKFEGTQLANAQRLVTDESRGYPDFSRIQAVISGWS
ncbi:hypothetical protein CWE13_08795 [Aliidiomarina shirensis]|uniref:Uncharacterized protein n=1 Tax=Aliidiomarina shirensis TaxID=1048642 RepID=A0A432WT32_9GAMM|nr:hypothetical protein CWE13_08795 [Aliidiomarina shirensis]